MTQANTDEAESCRQAQVDGEATLDGPGTVATEATDPAQQVDADTCRSVEVDGQTVLMRGAGELTEQEQQFAAEILRAAKEKYAEEHVEPDAQQLRALAFNVIGPVLRARGEHLPLTARRAVADAVLDVVLHGARITAPLGRMSDADVRRVVDLYERWVKAGPPPLGTSVSRWWDARLIELHNAILPEQQPGTDQPKEQ